MLQPPFCPAKLFHIKVFRPRCRPPLQLHLCRGDAPSKGSSYHRAQPGNDQNDDDGDAGDDDDGEIMM